MGIRKWGKFTGILTFLVMICMALGGFLLPGTAYAFDWGSGYPPTLNTLNGVWGNAAGDVFAVGYGGIILHYNGTWTAMSSPTANNLWGVWGSSASDVFAVGQAGLLCTTMAVPGAR